MSLYIGDESGKFVQIPFIKGEKGEAGPAGADGKNGQDGYTPQKGVDYFDGKDGEDGKDGQNGQNGGYYTPKVSFPGTNVLQFEFEPSVEDMPTVPSKTITIPAGKDGVGIKSVVLNSDYTLTIRYTDGTYYTSESIRGEKGEPGKDGSDGVSVTHEWDGTVLKITSASGTSSANLKGEKGDNGEQGIQGPKGDPGKDGSDASVTATNIQNALGFTPANPSVLSLGIHTDGLVYLFVSGQPVGNGIELSATGDVIGYVDENNNIVVRGNLAEGTYSVKYEMDDGTTVDIGDLVVDNSVYYSVATNLTQCTNSNTATKVIGGQSYSTTIMANSGHEIKSVIVTMGGTDVSSTAVSGGDISIAEVTGDIVITAVAEENKVAYTNLADPTSADWAADSRINSSGSAKGDTPGFVVTNYIPVTKGQTIHIKGAELVTGYNVGHYKLDKTLAGNSPIATLISNGQIVAADYDTNVTTYKNIGQYGTDPKTYAAWSDNMVYARLTIQPTGAASDIIITVDQEIK